MGRKPGVITESEAKKIIRAAQKAGLQQIEFYIGDVRVKVPLVPEEPEVKTGDWIDAAE